MRLAVVSLVLLAACGDDGGGKAVDARVIDGRVIDATVFDASIDAPFFPDAQNTVLAVSCPSGTPPEVTAPGFAFQPMTTTISVGETVKFTMPGSHSVIPHASLPTDDGLRAPFSTSTCLLFTVAGTYNFQCNPHGFAGSVIVQ